jgi:hypothetical protein
LQQDREYACHSYAKELTAYSNLPEVIISASFGAADISRSRHPHSIYQVGKVSSLQNLQVPPSDCVRVPEGAAREPSLIFGSLEKALCNLADMGLSLMELQKVLRASSK